MDLHIKDRLLIPSIFPERGNFMDFNLKKSIARKIAISEQDRKDYEIVEKKEEKRIEWNVQKDAETPLVVEFSKEELDYMRRSCEAIAEQQMPDEMWAVVERIYNEAQLISYFFTHNHIFHTNGNLSYCTDSHLLF